MHTQMTSHEKPRRPAWLVPIALLGTPHLTVWLFLCFTVRPSDQPLLFATCVWLLCVKIAFFILLLRHLTTSEADRPRGLPSRQVIAIGAGFLVAAGLIAGSAAVGEGTMGTLAVLYVFLALVFFLLANTPKPDTSNSAAAGAGGVEAPSVNRDDALSRRA